MSFPLTLAVFKVNGDDESITSYAIKSLPGMAEHF